MFYSSLGHTPSAEVILKLIRMTWCLLDADIKSKAITDNLITISQAVSIYCSFKVMVTSTRRGAARNAVYHVPKEPGRSPLFLRSEMAVITAHFGYIFTPPSYSTTVAKWVSQITSVGWKQTISDLRDHYSVRDEWLRLFASTTSKRLNSVRSSTGQLSKKKKDVSLADLQSWLAKVPDPGYQLATELWNLHSARNNYRVNCGAVEKDFVCVGIPPAYIDGIKAELAGTTVPAKPVEVKEGSHRPVGMAPPASATSPPGNGQKKSGKKLPALMGYHEKPASKKEKTSATSISDGFFESDET
jgi:hypothetical protein